MASRDLPSTDPGLLELFQSEMDAHIPALNSGLLALEKGLAGAPEIEAMMRAAHSIKGAAKIVGIEQAVRVAHTMEDCFTAAKESRVVLGSDSVDVLLRGVDALQRVCSPGGESGLTEEAILGLLESIQGVKAGGKRDEVGKGQVAGTVAGTERSVVPAAVVPAAVGSVAVGSLAGSRAQLVAATVESDEPSVTLPAVLSDEAAEALRKQLLDTLGLRPERLQIDFGHVGRLTAPMLALVASFAREAGAMEPAPVVTTRGASGAVQHVLCVAGLGESLGLAESGDSGRGFGAL
jgi:chemotaxis protein histidine kinase CheA